MEQKEHEEQVAVGASPAGTGTKDPSDVSAGTKKDQFLPVSILIAAVVIGASIILATLYHPSAGQPAANNQPAAGGNAAGTGQPVGESAAQIDTLGPRDAVLGNPNAPVTVIEYGDYQCPFCGRYFSQLQPQLVQQYINTGKVRMVFRNFAFLGAESTAAAEAAECAEDQNQLWPYHDALYQAKVGDVAKGGGEDDGFFNQSLFLQLAKNVNLDLPTFTSCIENHKDSALVNQDNQNASAAGVNSTPTTFINGRQVTESDGSSAGADVNLILQQLAIATAGK